jgi:hypothetical protein
MSDWGMNDKAIAAGHEPYDPESEWQPVRIAPAAPVCCDGFPGTHHHVWRKTQGMIVRVRPVTGHTIDCPTGRVFLIHPDDTYLFEPDLPDDELHVCEHQIQAD